MKVKDLIRELSEFDPEARVVSLELKQDTEISLNYFLLK
jgi:hypothetical protein